MTTDLLPRVVAGGWNDLNTAAELIADAFTPLAVARWLVPDPGRRTRVLRDQMAILAEHALFHGRVDLLADFSGVAVWFDRTRPVAPPRDYDRRLRAVCGPDTDRFTTLDALLDAHYPHGQAHHHLALLAVAPDLQGTGRGSALLRHGYAVADLAGVPTCLDASSGGSRDLYLRHGYEAGEPFHLPDGPPLWPMRRPPRPVGRDPGS
ncbi:GNAT family N-acetyltransferase [Solwaraspora sp. WMMD1047]|uniref:GNAT family N-acetyltransferase n=1 Tax=Solwaraspora sp. WMMD1047 TaxID=3016102 RepID=UPI002417ED78|nr:GNAT family N-acetyltransferase [Solwaraspora sp. WMMD1047]MDG4829998.1 GNAT family N-acetyltransferase [Solwaraspora sp. WMMD1047]